MDEQAVSTRPTRATSRRRKVAWIALIVLVLAVVVFARALIPAWSHWVWQELSAEQWPPIEPRARTVDFEHRF